MSLFVFTFLLDMKSLAGLLLLLLLPLVVECGFSDPLQASLFAGSPTPTAIGGDGSPAGALTNLNQPADVSYDAVAGSVYITESTGCRIRKIIFLSTQTGFLTVSTFVGDANAHTCSDVDGPPPRC